MPDPANPRKGRKNMGTKVKFGLRLNIQGEMGAISSAYDYTLEMARMAEDLGFDWIWIPDRRGCAGGQSHRRRGGRAFPHRPVESGRR